MADTQATENPNAAPGSPMPPDLENVFANQSGAPGQLIPLLQRAQETYGYISPETISYLAGLTGDAEAKIYGVVTFYKQFRLAPLGEYLVRVCDGTACHVNGSIALLDIINDELGLDGTTDTTPDGKFTVETVACLGCCSLAPVITVNEDTHGRLSPLKLRKVIKRYKRRAKKSAAAAAAKTSAAADGQTTGA